MKFCNASILSLGVLLHEVHAFVPNSGSLMIQSYPHTASCGRSLQQKQDSVDEVIAEASDALQSVGWTAPSEDGELTSDDPFVQRINSEILQEMGVPLDELLNPATVVNLERDLYSLRYDLAVTTGLGDIEVGGLTTAECDGGGQSEEIENIRKSIDKKEKKLFVERRSVFRGWLKNVFLGQAVLSLVVSFIMASNPAILFGKFDWFYNYQMLVDVCFIININIVLNFNIA